MSANEMGRAIQPAWRRASFCASGECVEIAQQDGMIVVRDSTQPQGRVLHYAAGPWDSFTRSIKSGRLDDLRS